MTTDEILHQERIIWGDTPQSIEHITVSMGKVFGDISKQARTSLEGGQVDVYELQKELGNMIASTIRWVDDLGFSVDDCIERALEAQRKYRKA